MRFNDLNNKDDPYNTLSNKGVEMCEKCRPEDSLQISDKLKKLNDRWKDTNDRAKKRKVIIQYI